MQSMRSVLRLSLMAASCAGIVGSAAAAGNAPPKYEVLQHWKLGGDGGWDYLTTESAKKRLFISRSTRVDVVDLTSGKITGSIPDTEGVHGIALAESLNRGFTSNGRANTVTAFDLDTLKVIQQAPVTGHNPDAILYEPSGKHVFTFNGTSKNATVLDAVSLAVVATIPLPDKPEFAAQDGRGNVFVNIESDPGQMVEIDVRKLTVKNTWPLPGCNSPSGLAIDAAHRRLFSVCDGKVMAVTDTVSGKQVALVPIGEHPDAAAFDKKRGLVYSSNGEGTLSIIREDSPDHYTTQETVLTQRGARTMALDPATGRAYLVTAGFGATPPATAEHPRPRPALLPDSFVVLVVGEH
jgi:YVTN family beta-propeller protein